MKWELDEELTKKLRKVIKNFSRGDVSIKDNVIECVNYAQTQMHFVELDEEIVENPDGKKKFLSQEDLRNALSPGEIIFEENFCKICSNSNEEFKIRYVRNPDTEGYDLENILDSLYKFDVDAEKISDFLSKADKVTSSKARAVFELDNVLTIKLDSKRNTAKKTLKVEETSSPESVETKLGSDYFSSAIPRVFDGDTFLYTGQDKPIVFKNIEDSYDYVVVTTPLLEED